MRRHPVAASVTALVGAISFGLETHNWSGISSAALLAATVLALIATTLLI